MSYGVKYTLVFSSLILYIRENQRISLLFLKYIANYGVESWHGGIEEGTRRITLDVVCLEQQTCDKSLRVVLR